MKLAKVTRRRLYEAGSEPIEVAWPKDAPEPLRGHRYPVFTKAGRAFQIRVEAVKRNKRTTALIVIDNDTHRPMVGLQGTRNETGDYESEPERVPEDYERLLAAEGVQKTTRSGAEHRLVAKRQVEAVRLERAKALGHGKTIKALERVGRAA